MTATVPAVGVDAFIAGLARCGVEAVRDGGVVTFPVEAVTRSGHQVIRTGVAATELQAWPGVPPHWVHLPAGVQLARTNADATETLPGWSRHSRDIQNWGNATEPAQAWLAHVRSVLQEAL